MSALATISRCLPRAMLTLAAATALSACTAGRINYVQVDTSYDPVQYARLPYTGPIYADISGNPFAIPAQDLNRIVSTSIQPSNALAGNGQGVRVHIAFGATESDRQLACQAGGSTGRINGTISMVAALCRGGGAALTYLVASIDGVTGPDDPRFQRFLRQSTVQLFPPRNPNLPSDDCIFPSC